MEKIVLAAIVFEGEIYVGKRHNEIIKYVIERTRTKKVPGSCPQGFVTSEGRFVERDEAGRIAIQSGQIQKLRYNETDLFSEDLW